MVRITRSHPPPPSHTIPPPPSHPILPIPSPPPPGGAPCEWSPRLLVCFCVASGRSPFCHGQPGPHVSDMGYKKAKRSGHYIEGKDWTHSLHSIHGRWEVRFFFGGWPYFRFPKYLGCICMCLYVFVCMCICIYRNPYDVKVSSFEGAKSYVGVDEREGITSLCHVYVCLACFHIDM